MSAEPKPIEEKPIRVDGLDLQLRRYGSGDSAPAVLLLHGASASSRTFLIPNGGLVQYLLQERYDVWTLDWRGSRLVVDFLPELPDTAARNREYRLFTLDRVGSEDIPLAVEAIRERTGNESVSVVAHCFGAGACAVAVAQGSLPNVHHVVLSTLGLFYEAPWDGWIKAEDFIIERVLAHEPLCRAIDPRHPERWPADMAEAFELYPRSWLPPTRALPADHLHPDNILRRLTFMFGQPYPPEVLAPGIHGPGLHELFGGMHVGLYLHAGQMVRRGYAAPFDEPDVIDRVRLPACDELETPRAERALWPPARDYLDPAPFRDKVVTLITGAQNRLWHRDSIDLMYEWLRNEAPPTRGGRAIKHVLPGYAHQDLLWGPKAPEDVFGKIAAGLPPIT